MKISLHQNLNDETPPPTFWIKIKQMIFFFFCSKLEKINYKTIKRFEMIIEVILFPFLLLTKARNKIHFRRRTNIWSRKYIDPAMPDICKISHKFIQTNRLWCFPKTTCCVVCSSKWAQSRVEFKNFKSGHWG